MLGLIIRDFPRSSEPAIPYGDSREIRRRRRQFEEVHVKESISTDLGPKAIGPYSQAVRANGFVFVSGQIALDPRTQELVPGDITAQAERVLENIKGILQAAGSSLEKVVRATVFLADMNEFASMNQVYARYFRSDFPSRSTVQAARLPRDVRVEIDVIALA
jgi:2-iminobutanoate/2-iminopropanoate deaminase